MKSLLINDLHYNPQKSVLPFCLKLSRDLHLETMLLHVVDPRNFQGTYSPVSDSQSITPAVQSFDEIIEKEEKESAVLINRFISKELPLLNYPLELKTKIEKGYSEDIIKEYIVKNDTGLLMINAHPVSADKSVIYNDVHYLLRNCKVPVLLVPAGIPYKKPVNVVFVDNSPADDVDHICRAIDFFRYVNPFFYIISRKKSSGISDSVYCEKIKGESGVNQVELIKISNEKFVESIADLRKNVSVDAVISVKGGDSFFKKLFREDTSVRIVRDLTLPVLVIC